MFSQESVSRDMSRSSGFLSSNTDNKDLMSSALFPNQYQNQQNGGLARYRSAPSSFLAALLDDNESEGLFCGLVNEPPLDLNQNQVEYTCGNRKQEMGAENNGFSYSVGMENGVHVKMNSGNGNGSNLVRQSSSPAGFFSGFGVMGDFGNYRVHNPAEANSSSTGLSNQVNFSSGPSSSSRFMPTIPKNGNDRIDKITPENGRLRSNNNDASGKEYDPSFHHDSWNESSFNTLKRNRDGDLKMFSNFNGLENQNEETRRSDHGLSRHLSLPKNSGKISSGEKFLEFQQDAVTCQIRAKRGCATHPRSIAERMRRIRISEKMKKLQDLFPDMDKQANTADMLDLAVGYIKDLQKQVQTLTGAKAKCICSRKPKQTSPTG